MKTETRIFAYPLELRGAKKDLIAEAESLGLVWSAEGFTEALNNDQINDQEYFYGTYEVKILDSNVTVNIVELASELAHERAINEMINNMLITEENEMFVGPTDGITNYTDEAQNVFDRWYDYFYSKIEECNI